MSSGLRRLVLLAVALVLAGGLRADWVVVDYDVQTDWVRHDFVGWVRVEQPLKAAAYARGTAAVSLTVIEQLAGEKAGPVLALEYQAFNPPKPGEDPELEERHYWDHDLPEHREFFVFLERLPNGGYWCGRAREFLVRDGIIRGLPEAYLAVVGGNPAPSAREFIAQARTSLPALRARVGRPEFSSALMDKGRPVETPQQGFEKIRPLLRAANAGELDRAIFTPGGGGAKEWRALLRQNGAPIADWPVQWQGFLEDKAVVFLNAAGRPDSEGTTFFLIRRSSRWQLINVQPDTEVARQQVALLLAEPQFSILQALFVRDHKALAPAP